MEQEKNEDKIYTTQWNVLRNLTIIMIVVILIFLILPTEKPTNREKTIICLSNLKQISLSVLMYSHDNDGTLPTAEKWNDLIVKYMAGEKPYRCPLAEKQAEKTCAYVLNRNLRDLKGPNPAVTVLAFEGPVGWNQVGSAEDMVYRHGNEKDPICNVALADGSVMRVKKSEAAKLKWEVAVVD